MDVLTLNIHNPGASSIDAVVDFLDESGAEVLALTECGLGAAEHIAGALDCTGMVHAHAPYWGNAILTRTRAIKGRGVVQLPPSELGEARSAAVADIETEGGSFRAIATHLDHLSEECRLIQARHLAEDASLDLSRSLLLGDLNALTRGDYTKATWEKVMGQRAAAGLSPAAADLTDWLLQGLGFEDAHAARPRPYEFTPTCSYSTRVDYILVGPRCSLRTVDGSYRVHRTIDRGITDHNAVAVQLE